MRELIQLQLPKVVEARKKRESMNVESLSTSTDFGHPLHLSQSSTSTGLPSPITPTFSARGHSRFPSSTSSLASSPPVRDSTDGFGVGKRPLTEVREEPIERDGDFEMVNTFADAPSDRTYDLFTQAMDSNSPISEADISASPPHYDLTDDHHYEYDYASTPTAKRRRAEDFNFTGFTQRFGSRMPSLSRKWRQRKAGNISIITQSFSERPSRANSIRAASRTPSMANSIVETDVQEYLPVTPARSVSGHRGADSPVTPIDTHLANACDEDSENEVQATTPLLPPMMVNLPSFAKEAPYQSPLQSPTVADRESVTACHTPTETPQQRSLPSPPLSTKPSVSSFHRQRALSYSNLTPTADIPPLPMVAVPDPWTDSLGHANFTIVPEPYLPTQFDVEACKQLRTDWEMARRNFSKHLMRTSEHYGPTSRIHKLTESKWAGIDAEWKRNSDVCLARTAQNGYEHALSQSQSSVAEPAPLAKLPSLNGPKSEGKFPNIGDQGIVGPMDVAASQAQQQQQQRRSTKRSFFRFLQEVFHPPNVNLFGRPLNRRPTA
ncbi:MAG: hypothetical protein LQ346_006489 [Caloplaca aetnensis]|nr:MAG: hypothetical protein LQ346_006489 [Caloplaca aetnensis]